MHSGLWRARCQDSWPLGHSEWRGESMEGERRGWGLHSVIGWLETCNVLSPENWKLAAEDLRVRQAPPAFEPRGWGKHSSKGSILYTAYWGICQRWYIRIHTWVNEKEKATESLVLSEVLWRVVVVLIAKSCLCDPWMQNSHGVAKSSTSGSSVHGISQARILEWVAMPFSRESSQPRDRACISCLGRQILYHWSTREALLSSTCSINFY